MSFVAWVKSLFGGARKRDISRLVPGDSQAEVSGAGAVTEFVDVSGAPLKERHRRRAFRDKRLLPKVKSPARQIGITKRPRLMSREEADRLSSGTMRTRNRNQRDLLADEEQLRRLGLPAWRTEQDIAIGLGISLKELWFFSIHRERERQPHYVTFSIPKRSGGKRMIMAPKRRLKSIQRKLLSLLVEKLPVHEAAHAFRAGRSIRTGAEPHAGKRSVLKFDLKDFFPTVTAARVRGLFIAYGYGYPVATTLALLMTEAQRQPVDIDGALYHVPVGQRHCVQGAPTSPAICNAILLRLDRRLAGVAKKNGLDYTRYADDLSFSGDFDRSAANKHRTAITRIISEEGFVVNAEKTKLMTSGSRQSVTGVVVNKTIGLSRQERRRMRAVMHRLKNKPDEAGGLMARFEGKVAYLAMLNKAQAAPFQLKPE